MRGLLGIVAMAVIAVPVSAWADLRKDHKVALLDLAYRCGKLHNTHYRGEPLVADGPFLHDLITLADSLDASGPERQFLRLDFRAGAESGKTVADALPKDELAKLLDAAKACRSPFKLAP